MFANYLLFFHPLKTTETPRCLWKQNTEIRQLCFALFLPLALDCPRKSAQFNLYILGNDRVIWRKWTPYKQTWYLTIFSCNFFQILFIPFEEPSITFNLQVIKSNDFIVKTMSVLPQINIIWIYFNATFVTTAKHTFMCYLCHGFGIRKIEGIWTP